MWDLRPERARQFTSAVAGARAGHPQVVCIDGDSGMGKSSHLRRLLDEADGFRILEAYGDPATYRPPFGVLQQFGVDRTTADDGSLLSPAIVAQSLRRLIDEMSRDGSLVLAVDDAQWADEESMDTLRLVLERLSGDRLLVAVASRPLRNGEHVPWRRFRDRPGAATVLTLSGIGLEEAEAMMPRATESDTVRRTVAERLWRHTDGNPMYLRSLLAQYSVEDLADATELPAPAVVARDLDARLSAVDVTAAQLLRAVAVTGSSWLDRFDAAAIADVDDASSALEVLLAAELLVARSGGPLTDVRIVHALVRAAVYQSMPAEERRLRHRRASQVLASPMHRLEHEVAAANGRDEELARRLERAAVDAQAGGDHHREAQLLRWASQLSGSVVERERRWLDSQLATVLARDVHAVRARLSDIAWASDVPRRTVVMAMLFIAESRISEARRLLESVADDDLKVADDVTRLRVRVLIAWTMLVSGSSTDRIAAVIKSVPRSAAGDRIVGSYYVRTAGQVAGREDDFDLLALDFDAVPLVVQDTPVRDTSKLGWRGAIYSMCGFAREGRRDLSEVVARIRDGRVDATGGVDQALYGFALWQDGELDRANIEFDAATKMALDRLQPLVRASLPLVPAVRGDFERADRLLDDAETVIRDLPWREAVSVLMMAQIVRLHAGQDAASRSGYLRRVEGVFGRDCASPSLPSGAIWHLHIALARLWAGDPHPVEEHLHAIEKDMIVPDWARWARPWLTGLVAEAAGDTAATLRLLQEATTLFNDELPLYRAHVFADLARIAAVRLPAVAADAAAQARELYTGLGATPYLSMSGTAEQTGAEAPADVFGDLSEREREVAALLVAGLSYAQIASELYVTRSTVGFHLGNIYAKTGVSTRHALTQLVRG